MLMLRVAPMDPVEYALRCSPSISNAPWLLPTLRLRLLDAYLLDHYWDIDCRFGNICAGLRGPKPVKVGTRL